MKIGLRTPSIKKSFKARTTGKYKRKLKRLTNPFYGKKGMGWIKNPSRALKNKIYHKTTFSAKSAIKGTSNIIGAILYYFIALPTKWIAIALFYMMKYMLLGMAWICVAVFNGIVFLIEMIINFKREDDPAVAKIVDEKNPLRDNETEDKNGDAEGV
ncbi:hypothetical protein [Butyrivibrio sp. INlla21]|uniref:hypothetical protein n=1 Tax=Butyrivibrio sp. INlla21 TaxID=1520811 RepID=UPI0008DF716A|nr:hypothetical protein [Butyrivibrio sp. INlla21]SFU43490.1 hypothetical protein SAMN02910342_00500 [Butyrivibrio sp. INlla21]